MSKPVIVLIWITWMTNILFSSLLMLNFLITVFSETHERVLASSIDYAYKTRADLNIECIAILKSLGMMGDVDHQIITAVKNEEIEDEVEALGIITNLTEVIKEYSAKVAKASKEGIAEVNKKLTTLLSTQSARAVEDMEQMQNHFIEHAKEITQVKIKMADIEEQLQTSNKEVREVSEKMHKIEG